MSVLKSEACGYCVGKEERTDTENAAPYCREDNIASIVCGAMAVREAGEILTGMYLTVGIIRDADRARLRPLPSHRHWCTAVLRQRYTGTYFKNYS